MTTGTLRGLLALGDAPRSRVALMVALGSTTIVFGVGLMATAGYLISRAAEQPAILSLTAAIVGVRFFGIARPIARYFDRLSSHDLAFRFLGGVRSRVYDRIEPLAPAQLEGHRRGDLLSRLVADVDSLQNLHLRGIGPPLVGIFAGAVSVAVAAAFLPAAGLVLGLGLLAGGLVVPALAAGLSRRSSGRAAARGELSAQLVEAVSGSAELVAFGRADDCLGRLRVTDDRLVRHARRAAFGDGAGEGLGLVVAGATVAGVLAVAVSAHSAGDLDRVTIALLVLLALAAFEAVQPLPEAARELAATLAAGRRVLELTSQEPAIVDPEHPAPFPSTPFVVELENVRARYAPGEPAAIDGLRLRLDPGRRIGLLGPSGAGKSTVTNLLLRFLDPEQGRVTVAGRDLSEYRQEDIRRAVAVSGQDAHLFSTTIRENVRLGRPGASDGELEEALDAARIGEWVRSLPDGLDTLVGEEGRELSGGQRQRITLARALLAEAPVLVLDEPTAHLDPPTAEKLLEDVFVAAGDRCVLLITHRPEGLDLVDEVVVIESAIEREETQMTGKADFTPEEWDLVREGPAAAGMVALTAERGGTFRESWAMAKEYAEARKEHGESELLDALVAEKPDTKRYHSAEELENVGLRRLSEAVALLEQKATLGEVAGYKKFVMQVAERVAEAHKEHGGQVSDAERAAIEKISAALNPTPV